MDIRDLLIMEHYGIISPEEKLKLEAILASDEDARAIQAEIKATIPKEKAQKFMEKIDTEKSHALIFARETYQMRVSHKKSNRQHWFVAIAVIIGILATGYFLYSSNTTKEDFYLADNPTITLQLANGKTIRLQDTGRQTVSAGQVQLNNSNRVLKFTSDKSAASGLNTLSVPTRLDYRVELSDGSVAWLNSATTMCFPFVFGKGKREVTIQGEAYFEVAPDPARPFIVHVNGTDIQVLGTSFNVNAYYPDKLRTSLVNGKIALLTGDERIELQPGKEALIQSNEKPRVRDFDTQITLGWKQGIHYFENAPMREIADMIPRWFNEKIIIDDPQAGAATFRIKIYRHQPLNEFITQINTTGTVFLYYKDGVLHCKST